MASVRNLTSPVEEWSAGGVPITMMMNMERRVGHDKPVIRKALTELDGAPYLVWKSQRARRRLLDEYRGPGPIQVMSAPYCAAAPRRAAPRRSVSAACHGTGVQLLTVDTHRLLASAFPATNRRDSLPAATST
jgi:hypothetical protein